MPALHELQRQMRDCLVGGTPAGAPPWITAPAGQVAERLEVYRTTVMTTLLRALRLSFPAVHRLVGAEFFEGAGQIFARQHLPGCADLNRYGEDFPAFLRGFEPCAGLRYLPDVARLDWAAAQALHASDAAPLPLDALRLVEDANAARVRFTPHPSLSLVRSAFPVDDIWRAVLQQDDGAMGAVDLASGPVHLLVERVADHVQLSRHSPAQWGCSRALVQGHSLGQVMETYGHVDLPTLLATHLAAGRFVAFHLSTFDGGSP